MLEIQASQSIHHSSRGARSRPDALPQHVPAQTTLPQVAKTADLSGQRFCLTLLADGIVKKLEERNIKVGPHIWQFDWQLEKQFYTRDSGVTMVTECRAGPTPLSG